MDRVTFENRKLKEDLLLFGWPPRGRMVIIMANMKNKKDGKVTAGDLFDRLKPKNSAQKKTERTARPLESEGHASIDASSARESSDSELDIKELLRKYMPDYEEEKNASSGGVLTKLKQSAESMEEQAKEEGVEVDPESDGDDRLISALDSAFGDISEGLDGTGQTANDPWFLDGEESDAASFPLAVPPSQESPEEPSQTSEHPSLNPLSEGPSPESVFSIDVDEDPALLPPAKDGAPAGGDGTEDDALAFAFVDGVSHGAKKKRRKDENRDEEETEEFDDDDFLPEPRRTGDGRNAEQNRKKSGAKFSLFGHGASKKKAKADHDAAENDGRKPGKDPSPGKLPSEKIGTAQPSASHPLYEEAASETTAKAGQTAAAKPNVPAKQGAKAVQNQPGIPSLSFDTAELSLGDIEQMESLLNEPQTVNRLTPEMRRAMSQSGKDGARTNEGPRNEADESGGFDGERESAVIHQDLDFSQETLREEPEGAAGEAEPTATELALDAGFDDAEATKKYTIEIDAPEEAEAHAKRPGETEEAEKPKQAAGKAKKGRRADREQRARAAAAETFSAAESSEGIPVEDIDPTDLNLRVAFGLDHPEVKDKGADREEEEAAKLGDRLEAKQQRREKRTKLDRAEFVDKTQIPKIKKEYKNRLASLWLRLLLCLVFTGALLCFENISFLTGLFFGTSQQFAGVFDPSVYPVVYIMASLQLMLLACLCAYEQILDGFKYLFRGTPRPESLTALLFVAGVLYSAILARIIAPPEEPVMFNFTVAFSAFLTLVYAIYNTKRERMNFDVVSARRAKHIIRRLPDEESQCEAQAFEEQTDVCDVMKIEKTDFIDGFFGRLNKPDGTVTVFMTCVMGVVLAAAVLFGFFINLRGAEGAGAVLRIAYLALLTVAPLSIFITFSYPFYRANVAAKEYDSAIIGEASLAEYSNASIISFDDKNVFPSYSVKIQNIRICNNARIDRMLYYAASVFAHTGGPLQDVFEVATLEMGHSDDVRIFDTEAGFLAAQVNGVNIIFGSYRALTAKGFYIPDEDAADDADFSDELSIMYMFREDKLVAKMYVKYVMDGDIDLILKQFQGTGLYVCVRTFDPNIDERMIAKKLNMRKIPLKVVRYASAEDIGVYEEKVDSGLVTNASPKSLLQVIAYCDKVLHTRKTNIALSALSVLIGIALLVLLILSDTVGVVNSLLIAVYHLIWTIPMVVSAKMFIR